MFKHRSSKKELLDGSVNRVDLYRNLDELHVINRLLGGYKISLREINKHTDTEKLTILDVGCGGGDMLRFLYDHIDKSRGVTFKGVDLKADCIDYARRKHEHADIEFFQNDFRKELEQQDDVNMVHANLFTHHLEDSEIIKLVDDVTERGKTLIINDLHRHWLAYYSIWLLTALFSKSHLVKHDAKLSVLRGFKRRDWVRILEYSNLSKAQWSVSWKWAFRYVVVIKP